MQNYNAADAIRAGVRRRRARGAGRECSQRVAEEPASFGTAILTFVPEVDKLAHLIYVLDGVYKRALPPGQERYDQQKA